MHCRLLLLHAPPAQHGWPGPPQVQTRYVLLLLSVAVPLHDSPTPQLDPGMQQGWPLPPHAVHTPLCVHQKPDACFVHVLCCVSFKSIQKQHDSLTGCALNGRLPLAAREMRCSMYCNQQIKAQLTCTTSLTGACLGAVTRQALDRMQKPLLVCAAAWHTESGKLAPSV
jgi:hypothetical protein